MRGRILPPFPSVLSSREDSPAVLLLLSVLSRVRVRVGGGLVPSDASIFNPPQHRSQKSPDFRLLLSSRQTAAHPSILSLHTCREASIESNPHIDLLLTISWAVHRRWGGGGDGWRVSNANHAIRCHPRLSVVPRSASFCHVSTSEKDLELLAKWFTFLF